MNSTYIHQDHEQSIYQKWISANIFKPNDSGQSYCLIMPPPNANDPLHVGHAMFVSVEDILIRYHRMLGDATLWLPGTDHAGIETQYVFEKKLAKEGKSRFQFDRAALYQMIWDYVQDNGLTAIEQMKSLGASADWSRAKFTLDPDIVDQVLTTFETMNQDGLIYRGEKLVNYCPKCGTAYSELEVKYVEKNDPLYYLNYQLCDGSGTVTVATVRPETIFADVAIAIHPQHPRINELTNQHVLNPLTHTKIPIIADEAVELEFGTGMLKITPGHDQTDFDIGQKHHLPTLTCIDFSGKLNSLAGDLAGQTCSEGRKQVLNKLDLDHIDDKYVHNVATCYRCGRVIEPLPMAQFFIQVKPLTTPVLSALDAGVTKIHGAGHDKILRHWLENLKDWNISRQIVWGIRMPVWYHTDQNLLIKFINPNQETVTGNLPDLLQTYSLTDIEAGLQTLSAPKDAKYVVSRQKPGEKYLQETDTFDTWFSSSQWPVVTLKTLGLFDQFYPTSVMETGYDILPFWVMRMMMMGVYLTGKMPFKDVYLHGLVRDEKGQKMSKSKGNVINPLTLVTKYGADALRMALVKSTTAGHDSAVGEMKVKGMRNFTNKIWNAARFVSMQQNENSNSLNIDFNQHLSQVITAITQQLNDFKIGLAAETAHQEFWHWFCDEAIEQCKQGKISQDVILNGLKTWLKLLHPFMPFVTEAIWQELIHDGSLLATTPWPTIGKK